MNMSIPRRREIRKAFKRTEREISLSLRALNIKAGNFAARGDYDRTQATMELAKRVQVFVEELEVFQKRFGQLGRGEVAASPARKQVHPQWAYYLPIVQCLVELGGEADRGKLEEEFSRRCAGWLLPADLQPMANGNLRWEIMIRRAKKHMVAEGLISTPNTRIWRITSSGRKAAQEQLINTGAT